MKKILLSLCLLTYLLPDLSGQYSLTTGNKALQISGAFMGFYNHRFYEEGETDRKKNRFNMDFAVFRLQGLTAKNIHYQLQINFPAISNPEANDEFLMQATTEWRNKKDNFSIQVGYDKIPFSRASLTPIMESAYMQRPEVVRGRTFNRRDMGVTLTKSFLNKNLNLYGGVYTGVGPQSIALDNDASGKLLYTGRVEASYPARYRYSEVDVNRTPLPHLAIGLDGAYSEKNLTTGEEYPLLTVNGKKTSYSADLSFKWKGLSTHLEWVTFRVQPVDQLILFGKPTDYYLAQGVVAQINYYWQNIHSVFAVRYDEFNPNDLIVGDNRQTISFAYNYLFDGLNSALKIHYFYRMKAENAPELWTEDQIRIGWQVRF